MIHLRLERVHVRLNGFDDGNRPKRLERFDEFLYLGDSSFFSVTSAP